MNEFERLMAQAKAIMDAAKGRDFTAEEVTQLEDLHAKAVDAKDAMERSKKATDMVNAMLGAKDTDHDESGNPKGDDHLTGSLAERFTKSASFKAFRKDRPEGSELSGSWNIKASGLGSAEDLGIGTKATITTATGQFVAEQRLPGYRSQLLDEGLSFLDLITGGTTQASFIEYATIVAETNNAAIVAEGELKPLSDVTTGKAEAKAYTYADGFDVTNQTLADDGALVAFMDQRIRYHVRNAVVDKLINGSGTGEPAGILNTTGVQQQAFVTDVLTTLGNALGKVEDVQVDPQAIVMNSKDIWALRFLKDAQGRYIFGGPSERGPISVWGVPVVKSNRVAQGTALAGNFRSLHFLEREALSVQLFNQHKDYAQRNMSYVRAELRGMQLFYSPRDVVVADLTA